MKITTISTVIVTLLFVASTASAQCSTSRCTTPSYQPAPQYQPITTYPTYYPPIVEPAPIEPPIDEIEPEPSDEGLFGVVSLEVQVQHPLTFAWQTVKTFDDELLADAYTAQIESRYWVIYTTQSGENQIR